MSEKRLTKPITEDEFASVVADMLLLKPNRRNDYIAIWCDYPSSVCKGVILKATSRATTKIQIVVGTDSKLLVFVKEDATISATIEVVSMLLRENQLPILNQGEGWQEKDLEVEQK